jgi:hypothetical protein
VKSFYKVTFVIKSTGDRNLLDGNIFCGQKLAGTLDPIVIQVVDRGALGHASKISAEIFRVHAGDLREILKIDTVAVIFGNIG